MPDIVMPDDLVKRLTSIGEDPANFRKMVRDQDAEFVRIFVDKLIESHSLYQKWAPRLFKFARECRKKQPAPSRTSLSESDRAKQAIYESKITSAERVQRSGKTVTMCKISLVGIPVAQKLWPGEDDQTVLLTPEESDRWDEIYSHPKEAFWWFLHYNWNIDDSPGDTRWVAEFGGPLSEGLNPGENPWHVTSGVQWGPLHGGERSELWSWNGRECRFVCDLSRIFF